MPEEHQTPIKWPRFARTGVSNEYLVTGLYDIDVKQSVCENITFTHVFNYLKKQIRTDLRAIGKFWGRRIAGTEITQVYRKYCYIKNQR